LTAHGPSLHPDWWRPLTAYWFHELTRVDWFIKNDSVDEALRSRFLSLYEQLSACDLDAATLSPDATLAAVLALDQLPRNLFRGTPRAFATDPAARKLTVDAVALEHDLALGLHERLFLYLPLEHSEDLADQDQAVDLISRAMPSTHASPSRIATLFSVLAAFHIAMPSWVADRRPKKAPSLPSLEVRSESASRLRLQ